MTRLDARKVYYLLSATQGLAMSLAFTVNQIYRVEVVGLNALQLVLVGTTLEITAFIFELPTGIVADVYSRRLSTIIGFGLFGLAFLIEGSLPTYADVLAAQVVLGIGWTFTSGALDAWIADEIGPEHVGPVFLRSSQFFNAGNLAAIPLAVVLGSSRVSKPILLGGGVLIALAIMLAITMPEDGFIRRPKESRQTWTQMKSTLVDSVRLVRTRPSLQVFVSVAAFVGLYSEGFDRLHAAHLLENFRSPLILGLGTVAWFGMLRAGTLLLSMAAAEIAERKVDLTSEPALIRALQLCFGLVIIGLVAFAGTRSLLIAVAAIWLINVTRATTAPLTGAWINRHIDSENRATVLSMSSQIDALGQFVGGPVLGAVGLRSLRAAFVGSAIILSPVIALYQRALGTESEPQGRGVVATDTGES
jgi:DHA3 family tetracycline resistance protein-like MFS transporter